MLSPRSRYLVLVAAAALGSASVIAAQHGGIPAPKVQVVARDQVVPFQLFRGTRILVQAKLNGRETLVMLDSGASTTTLDRKYARSIGLPEGMKIKGRGTGGEVEAELVSGVSLEIGGVRFDDMAVGVMDLDAVSKAIGHPVNVIVGREFFNSAVISFDWAAGKMTVSSASDFVPPKGAKLVELGTAGPFHTVPVAVGNGPTLSALLDIGNGGTLSLPADYWQKRHELAKLPFAEGRGGGVGGLHGTRSVTLPSIRFGGTTFSNVPASLSEKSESGHATEMANVGIGVLRQFRATLDLGHSKIYLVPNAKPDWQRDRAGTFVSLAGDRLKVLFVSPNSPAQRAGLREGDEIVAVDGLPVSPALYERADWAKAPAGTAVTLTKADGTQLKLVLADYY